MDIYKEENKSSENISYSPSGKYKLIHTTYKTGENTWNYSKAELFDINDPTTIISTFKRNYGSLHGSWFTRDGQEWFQSGETYMSQCFVNLDTKQFYSNKEQLEQTEEYKKGFSFCWAGSKANPSGTILAVDGCYWACPYELKFFDFSDPSNVTPMSIIQPSEQFDIDFNNATWIDDNTFEYTSTSKYLVEEGKPPIHEDDIDHNLVPEEIWKNQELYKEYLDKFTYKREGNTMKLISTENFKV